jgi:AcrR family transcriptional regulator
VTQVEDQAPTRRERQREATFEEIVRASRELLNDGAELSLRAVASKMGLTAPALYRYVSSYQELVDLVAYEVDRAATDRFAAAADTRPTDDFGGRLLLAVAEFRMWALANPHEFALVFANPIADTDGVRSEMHTTWCSGHLFTDQIFDLWQATGFPIPEVDDLPPSIQESIRDPLMPAKVERIPDDKRGLVWIYMQGWTQLYGVVALEVMGHMDPRVIESGEMFIDVVRNYAPRLGLGDDWPRLEALVREWLAG